MAPIACPMPSKKNDNTDGHVFAEKRAAHPEEFGSFIL